MIAFRIIEKVLADIRRMTLPVMAVLLATALFAAPMMQTSVTIVLVEECGSKPPPIIEEEVHKSIAPAGLRLSTPSAPGVAMGRDTGPGDHTSPVRDILVPAPNVC